jgi:DNA-binding transcriptional LysR family regulator
VEIAPWLAINDYQLVRCVALANGGFARLPRYLVEPDVRTAMLVRVLAEYQLPHTPLFLVFPQRQPQPPQVRVLIDFVDAWFNPRR